MPYSNVPEHLQDKMERCVQGVLEKQPELEKENAIAICFRSVIEKGRAVRFTMKMTKTQELQNGRIRWSARANTGEFDRVQDRFDEAFFDDVIHNFYRVAESLSRNEDPPDGMTEPILDISHYSIYLPKDRRSLARAGWPAKMWRDGRALFAQGFFDDSPLGQIASKAALNREPEDRRVSIVVFPDWTLVKMEGERRLFTGGNQKAWLDSIAMTAHPMDPGAQLEVKSDMTITLAEDARAVLGDDADELIQELESARTTAKGEVLVTDALVKTEGTEMPEDEKDIATEVVEEEVVEEETTEKETVDVAALSEAAVKATVDEVIKGMLPGIGEAIDKRLKPIRKAVDTLATDMEVIKTDETAKVAAAIDNGGDWYTKMFDNSVQGAENEGAVKGEKKGPQEAKSDYGSRYGNK